MRAILRILDRTGAQDFDLSAEKAPIGACQLLFTPTGEGWTYRSPTPVNVNGRQSRAGQVNIWDAYLVDYATRTKVLILPKVIGERRTISFTGELSVGRGEGNRLRLNDAAVSGSHCVFYWDGGSLYVRDNGSTNGTYVNNRLVVPGTPWRLESGDAIKLGRYTLGVGRELYVHNADEGVCFRPEQGAGAGNAGAASAGGGRSSPPRQKKPYPWFSRAPRMNAALPPLSIQIEDAPGIGEKPSLGMSAIAMSIPAMALSFGMTALRYGLGRRKYSQLEQQRAELYTRYLTGVEDRLQTHAKRQRELAVQMHPPLRDCVGRVEGPALNLWERHPGDEDFLSLRLGVGRVPAAAQVTTAPRHLQMKEDEFTRLPEQVAAKYAFVDDIPICCELMRDGVCGIIGSRPQAVQLAQSMVAQIAALHSYDEVKLVVIFPKAEWGQWSWMRWLPHCASAERDMRYIACTREDVKEILPPLERVIKERIASEQEWTFGSKSSRLPHYVFVVADPSLLSGCAEIGSAMMMNRPELGLNGIVLGQSLADFPHSVHNVIRVGGTGRGTHLELIRNGETMELDSSEHNFPVEAYRVFARKMAPIRLAGGGESKQQSLPSMVTLFQGLGIQRIEALSLDERWRGTQPEEEMSVPIGVRASGELFHFNIHENAQGPHGLVAGGTGSGKSKMVQSWVASMAIRFSPADVNFILVDFKGESLVSPFRNLPHLAGFTSNIDSDVRRKFLAIESEMSRRMRLLKTGGEKPYDDIIAYRRARRKNLTMEPLPFLFLVVDEFAAFKDQYPEFIAPIDHLYQAGRSLGMMAILMTQQPSGKITAQMDANMGFSWCLQVKDEADSREVIGTADAAHLRGAGRAYVKAKDGTYELIQSLYGMTPYEPDRDRTQSNAQVFALKLNGRTMEGSGAFANVASDRPDELTVLANHIAKHCEHKGILTARPIWHDPLPNKLELDALEGMARQNSPSGMVEGPKARLGLFDDPAHQAQDVFEYDFWAQGNLAVYGTSLTGKTTFLQTLLLSLCRRYRPDEAQFYLIEQGAYRLRTLGSFPHVGGTAGDDEPDTMAKIVQFLLEELERRKKSFRKAGVGSPEGYAERTGKAPATIFLLADHINLLGDAFYELQNKIVKLAVEGPAYAMFTVCAFSGALGVNTKLKQAFKQAVALRLPDRFAYGDLVGKITDDPETLAIGRGYIRSGGNAVLFQTAIFRAKDNDGQRAAQIQRLADELRAQWNGPLPTPIRTMPEEIPYGTLDGPPLVLGMDYEANETVSLTAPRNSLMAAVGTEESMRLLFRSLARQTLAQNGEVWLCVRQVSDYADLVDDDHLLTDIPALDALIPTLRAPLQARQTQHAEDPQAVFTPIVLLVEDMKLLLEEAETETTGRLEAFVRLCKELGFILVCAGSPASMNFCRYCGSSLLAVTMRGADRLIAGGNLAEHQLFDTAALRVKHPEPLAADDAFLLTGEGAAPVHMKLMRGDPDA